MTIKPLVKDGWGALHGAMIFSPAQVPLPIGEHALIAACQQRWPDQTTARVRRGARCEVSVDTRAVDECPFVLSLYEGHMMIGMDGTPQQNVVTAAWIRSLMPWDAPRMVVANQAFSVHAELPFGVTPDEIAATMVDHSVAGWDADDPEMQAL